MRADAQRNRARVLAAAQEAFAEDGIAVPLDEIARRAGVGAGTVYRHFPTKEALFEAVMLDRVQSLAEHARSLIGTENPGTAFFEFLRHMITGAARAKAMVDALAGTDLSITGPIAAAKQELRDAGAELLVRAQRAGAVREDVDATVLLILITSTSVALQRNPAARETMFAILRDGLKR